MRSFLSVAVVKTVATVQRRARTAVPFGVQRVGGSTADVRPSTGPRVVLAVTSATSLRLMSGYPEYLATQGWDPHVVADVQPEGHRDGVTWHSVAMSREPSLRDVWSLVLWIRLVRRLRPDMVVAGTPKAGLLGMLAARICHVPVRIYLLRGLRFETETGPRRKILILLERLTARCSSVVQSVSPSLREVFIGYGLAPATKVVVVGRGSSNGVDVRMTPPESGTACAVFDVTVADTFVLGFVGRVHRDKGVDVLLKAAQCASESLQQDLHVLIVGPEEPTGLMDDLLATGLVDSRRVRYVGPVSRPEAFYPQMDALCLPSRREGFPNVVLEAATFNVPAIVSDATGSVDSVVDGVTGYVFPVDDYLALASRISALAAPGRAQDFGRAARDHAVAHYERGAVWRANEKFLRTQMMAQKQT